MGPDTENVARRDEGSLRGASYETRHLRYRLCKQAVVGLADVSCRISSPKHDGANLFLGSATRRAAACSGANRPNCAQMALLVWWRHERQDTTDQRTPGVHGEGFEEEISR